MFWFFAAVVLVLAVYSPGFRRVLLWFGAGCLAIFCSLGLILS